MTSSNFLLGLDESAHLNRLQGKSMDDVKNAFMANLLATLLILRTQDLDGLVLVNDRSDHKIKSFSPQMRDLKFWGRALFHPEDKEVKKRILPGHADLLHRESGRIFNSRIEWLMKLPSTSPENINWHEVTSCLLLLRHRYTMRSSYMDRIISAIYLWDRIKDTQKRKAINDAFMYLLQSDQKSALLTRMRALSTRSLLSATVAAMAQRVIGFKRLHENESISVGGIASGGNAIVGANSGASAITQPEMDQTVSNLYGLSKLSQIQVQKRGKYMFRDNKIVKKKPKKFKAIKFKAPKHMKLDRTPNKGKKNKLGYGAAELDGADGGSE